MKNAHSLAHLIILSMTNTVKLNSSIPWEPICISGSEQPLQKLNFALTHTNRLHSWQFVSRCSRRWTCFRCGKLLFYSANAAEACSQQLKRARKARHVWNPHWKHVNFCRPTDHHWKLDLACSQDKDQLESRWTTAWLWHTACLSSITFCPWYKQC